MTDEKPDVKTEHKVIIPGVAEAGRAIEKATDEVIVENSKGLRSFLGHLCSPAAEQYGEAWADQVKQFRYLNHLRFLDKAQVLHRKLGIDPQHTVKPRLMLDLIEASSMEENHDMQDWWAGLSISSIEEVPSDDNLIFINMMKQITATQRILIEFICTQATIVHTKNNLIIANSLVVPHEKIVEICGIDDIDKLDREMDSLNYMGLISGGGYDLHATDVLTADISPTSLCLHFYARCNGHTRDLINILGAEPTD